jgi:type II secretory pathway pseudopilin PulG
MVTACTPTPLPRRQRGSVVVLFALLLPVLLGFTALAVDISRIQLTKQELQNAADAAALAGAAMLNAPGGETPYNWTAATQTATGFIGKNPVSSRVLTSGDVLAGYIRPGDTSVTVHSPTETGWISPFDVPVVRVGLDLSVGKNGGPLQLLFGAILGSPTKDLHVVATAAAYPPGYAAAGALFPVVLGRCLYDLYWNYATRSPKLDPATGKPYNIQIGSVYNTSCLSGEWSTFNTVLNDVPSVQALITNGNPVPLQVGSMTYVQSGVKDSVYNSVPFPKTVAVPVINNVVTGSNQVVVAIAAFQITGVVRIDGKSYIQGNFTEGLKVAGLSAGGGGGQDLGAQTGIPSILIQ